MENQLKEQFIDFRDTTTKLIMAIEKEDYDLMDKFVSERQNILDKLSSIEHVKDELAEVYTELELVELDNKLKTLMIGKLDQVRADINKLSESKSARKSYNNKVSVDALYLNKKI